MNKQFWAQQQRATNIHKILSWIEQADKARKKVSKMRLINVIMSDMGCSKYKANEYLQVLEGTGNIQIIGDEISYIPKKKEIEKQVDQEINKIVGGQNVGKCESDKREK